MTIILIVKRFFNTPGYTWKTKVIGKIPYILTKIEDEIQESKRQKEETADAKYIL